MCHVGCVNFLCLDSKCAHSFHIHVHVIAYLNIKSYITCVHNNNNVPTFTCLNTGATSCFSCWLFLSISSNINLTTESVSSLHLTKLLLYYSATQLETYCRNCSIFSITIAISLAVGRRAGGKVEVFDCSWISSFKSLTAHYV